MHIPISRIQELEHESLYLHYVSTLIHDCGLKGLINKKIETNRNNKPRCSAIWLSMSHHQQSNYPHKIWIYLPHTTQNLVSLTSASNTKERSFRVVSKISIVLKSGFGFYKSSKTEANKRDGQWIGPLLPISLLFVKDREIPNRWQLETNQVERGTQLCRTYSNVSFRCRIEL